jgi:DNA polymerase V
MGFPSPARDYAEERLSLDKLYIPRPNSTFFMQMENRNFSMVNAFVPPGALLVIDRSITPANMDMVVASCNGEYTVRYLRKNEHHAWLAPANPKMQEVLITPGMDVEIFGVVVAFVVDPKKLPLHVCPH